MRVVALLLCALLAGCVASPAAVPEPTASTSELRLGMTLLHQSGVKGGLSMLHVAEGTASITFPPGVLVLGADGFLLPPTGAVALAQGQLVQFLPPYGATQLRLNVTADGITRETDLTLGEGTTFVNGQLAVDLLKVQRDRFPHRTPGQENYEKSVTYFEGYFAALGYEVETFRSPAPVSFPLPGLPTTQSLVSVVAYKRGTSSPERYLAFGGHFDVVEETTDGAFDNTGGTMATLALATAFSRINTSHTMIFAAWGGEEDGILGSQSWVTAHPEMIPFIDLYVNYDVTGLAWPAPLIGPASIVAATGPDGPLGTALAAQHASIVKDWMQLDVPFVYEGVGQGQVNGAGVNAQSDHTPFMARGVPVLFQFTQEVDDAFTLIHKETDTVDNMTRYAFGGPEAVGQNLSPSEMAEGEKALALSFESQMAPGFYLAVLTDAGVIANARPAASFPGVEKVRS